MERWTRTGLVLALAAVSAGCDDANGPDSGAQTAGIATSVGSTGATPGSTSGAPGSSDSTTSPQDGPAETTGDPSPATDGPRFDVGTDEATTEGIPEQGCAKVDFLFVIDNSPSMRPEQEALVASFPGFMETISTTLSADSDYHIMVADTDAGDRCVDDCEDSRCIDPEDGDYACTASFDTCDHTLGAGKVHPAGEGASNELCSLTGGNRYITQDDVDLTGSFECIATVGLAGHPSERPMDSLVAALSDPMNAAGSCNDGFLRDDAILVVTFISDDPHYEDAGVPQDWYDAVVEAKNGDPNAVVVLGMTPAWDGCGNQSQPDRGAHWVDFIELWGDRGLHGSVCENDFTPFFQDAIDIIDVTCDEFQPPG